MDYQERFPIPPALKQDCLVDTETYLELYRASIEDPQAFWGQMAREHLDWLKPWEQVLQYDYHKAQIAWFLGAKINVCHNCVDRHLNIRPDKTALIWEGNEPGECKHFTYRQLHREVSRIANVLLRQGVRKGDRVAIYLPMIPEAVFSMLACARIGAVHSVIFAGFSADSVRDRVLDSQCKIVITANEGLRGSKAIALKKIVDEALRGVDCVSSVLVVQRTSTACAMTKGRDLWLEQELQHVSDECAYEVLDAEDPLFILYTSGSTGKPKGVLHTQAGYLLYAAVTQRYVFDCKEADIYFCAADVGWVTGHSYIVYGPLANGATTLMFESLPNYPDAGRYWDIVERHKVSIFYTAPTAIRAIAKEGDQFVKRYNRTSLRVLGSVGEPINRDAWLWYRNIVGEGRCAIVDTWWQTETGGILISPLPGAIETKAGSATLPFFGVLPLLLDEHGKEIRENGVKGKLCIKHPWPGQMRTVYGDHQRFIDTYFKIFPGVYFTGDAAIRDHDGYYWILGRVDDVLNVSGHRLGTAEIESAIVQSGVVAEAAVVGRPHEVKGTAIYAFCVLRDSAKDAKGTTVAIKESVRKVIGAFAVPDIVQCVPGLPKTRSGKIMRRILRKIAEGEFEHIGDTTTLADPAVVNEIINGARAAL